jgi:capsular polysaccharide transport system permease protein
VSPSKRIALGGVVFAVLLYFIVITPRIYTSEARIMVEKSGSAGSGNSLLGLIQGGSSSKEARMLREYVLSPAMLADLDKKFALRSHYAEPFDPIRSIGGKASTDEALKFFRRMTGVHIDENGGLIVISAKSFDPVLSHKVLSRILEKAEEYLNQAASEVVVEQMDYLQEQVKKSAQDLEKARMDLVAFQDQNRLLTPQEAANPVLGAIGRLEGELVVKRAELQSALAYLNPTSAEAVKLKSLIEALQTQIQLEKDRLTGAGNGDRISSTAAAFEKQKMRVEFAADVYKASITALEKAQFEAAKKSRMVVMVQPPTLPEDPSYPKPWKHVPLTLLFGYLAYLLSMLVVQVVREHR